MSTTQLDYSTNRGATVEGTGTFTENSVVKIVLEEQGSHWQQKPNECRHAWGFVFTNHASVQRCNSSFLSLFYLDKIFSRISSFLSWNWVSLKCSLFGLSETQTPLVLLLTGPPAGESGNSQQNQSGRQRKETQVILKLWLFVQLQVLSNRGDIQR